MDKFILDQFGRPVRRKVGQFGVLDGYDGASYSDRLRDLGYYSDSKTEDDLLPFDDRLRLIGRLRRWYRNNPILAAIVHNYSTAVGSPIPRVQTNDANFNDIAENYLIEQFKKIGYQHDAPMNQLVYCSIGERLLTGEAFPLKINNGQIQLLPAELCGHDDCDSKEGGIWIQGVKVVNEKARAFRFGRRIRKSYSSAISYKKSDGARDFNCNNIYHVGRWTRSEEVRFIPPMAPAMTALKDLEEIVTNKVTQIKNQSALAIAIKKNLDPSLAAELANYANTIRVENPELSTSLTDEVYGSIISRSSYQSFSPGMVMHLEPGEAAEMLSPSIQAVEFDAFYFSRLQTVCSVIGMPVEEALTGYGKSNYSSSRADRMRWRKTIDNERALASRWILPVCNWILERGAIFGEIPEFLDKNPVSLSWPAIQEIDQVKSATANIAEHSAGLKTKSEIAAERGAYFEDINTQLVFEAVDLARRVKKATYPEYNLTELNMIPVSEAEVKSYLPGGDPQLILASLNNVRDNT